MQKNYSKNYLEKSTHYIDIISKCPNYIGLNYAVENENIYFNEFISENKSLRVEISKKRLRGSSQIFLYLISIFDNNFSLAKEEYKNYLIEHPNYRGKLFSFDFVQNIDNKNTDEMLKLINQMRIVCANPKNNFMLLTRRISYIKYINTMLEFSIVGNEMAGFFQQNNEIPYAIYPYRFVKINVKKSDSTKRLDEFNPLKYKYRKFYDEKNFYFTEYEFYWKFLIMLAEAYNAQ